MTKETNIQIFDKQRVRTIWDSKNEKWYFSIVDVCAVLTESVDATAYWRKLNQRLKLEGNETVTNCHALKLQANDGKMRKTDVADQEGTGYLNHSRRSIFKPLANTYQFYIWKSKK